jgi:hypothetical protein
LHFTLSLSLRIFAVHFDIGRGEEEEAREKLPEAERLIREESLLQLSTPEIVIYLRAAAGRT